MSITTIAVSAALAVATLSLAFAMSFRRAGDREARWKNNNKATWLIAVGGAASAYVWLLCMNYLFFEYPWLEFSLIVLVAVLILIPVLRESPAAWRWRMAALTYPGDPPGATRSLRRD